MPGRQHLIEDGAFPSALAPALGLFLATRHAWRGGRRVWHDLLKRDLLANRATCSLQLYQEMAMEPTIHFVETMRGTAL